LRKDKNLNDSFFWNLGIDEKKASKKVIRWANDFLNGVITEEELVRRIKRGEN